jgi:ACT domain-containing protein
MTRFSSQLIFGSPNQILRRRVIEQNEENIISRIFSLDDNIAESAQTFFFDGIISSEIISLKQHITADEINNNSDFQYIDLSIEIPEQSELSTEKSLILDFGTDNINEINQKIPELALYLENYSITEIIAACTYYPAIFMGKMCTIKENNKTQLVLWQNIDFMSKRITKNTKLRTLA